MNAWYCGSFRQRGILFFSFFCVCVCVCVLLELHMFKKLNI